MLKQYLCSISRCTTKLIFRRNASVFSGQEKSSKNNHDLEYSQGQYLQDGKTREYFYYLDHQGQLFLDDTKIKNFTSCYKEQKFLEFFFSRLRMNETDRYSNKFPFISLCGLERNYFKCEDLPFVITNLDENNDLIRLNQIQSAHWAFHFDPERLFHNLKSGRLYYLFEGKELIRKLDNKDLRRLKHLDKLPCKIALVKSDLSIKLMEKMKPITSSDDNSFSFEYKSKFYKLNNDSTSRASKLVEKFSNFERD